MNKTAIDFRPTIVAPPQTLVQPTSLRPHRLVAVISDVPEQALLAGQILSLSRSRGLEILLLGVSDTPAREIELRRKLVMLAAFIQDAGAHVDIRVEHGRNWLEKVRMIVDRGDLLACSAEDRGETRSLTASDGLGSLVALPIHVLSASARSMSSKRSLPAQLVSWLGSVAILLGFLLLQMRLTLNADTSASTVWLLLSVLAEVGLIFGWNALVG